MRAVSQAPSSAIKYTAMTVEGVSVQAVMTAIPGEIKALSVTRVVFSHAA